MIQGQKECRTIEIEGNLVRLMRHTVEKEHKTSDFLAELMKGQPMQSGPLPPGCVYHSRRMGSNNTPILTYVLELGPHLRRMEMDFKRGAPSGTERLQTFECAWPSTLWCWRLNGSAFLDLYLVGTKGPFMEKGMDTDIYVMPTPNIHGNGQQQVCIGTPDQSISVSNPPHVVVHGLQQHMMVSYWNDDLTADYSGAGLTGLEDWAAKSKADPDFAKKMKRRAHQHRTFAGLMHYLDTGTAL